MDRRNFIGSTVASAVAAALAPGKALARLGFGRGIGNAGGFPAPTQGFDYYISPTGSAANAGTLASPFDISVFAYTPSSNTRTYFLSLLAGKRIGLLPGTYPVYQYWDQQISQAVGNTVCLGLPSGTVSSPTYIASCDSSGNYSPRTATLDAHPSATVGQSSVTTGIAGRVTAVAVGNPTVITFTNPPAITAGYSSNPFSVGQQVWFDDSPGNGWSAIGIAGNSDTGATYYNVTAVGGSVGAWTITVDVATSGTWTPSSYPTVYYNYPAFQAGLIGQSQFGGSDPAGGNWTLDGLIITGAYQFGVIYWAHSYSAPITGQLAQISAISTGSTTTVTINSTGASNPFSVGENIYLVGIQATGTGETLTSLNYSKTTQNRYAITAIGGASGAWTFTLSQATSGTFTSGTGAWVGNAGGPVAVKNCEIFDCMGMDANNPAAIYIQSSKDCYVGNCKIYSCNLAMGEGNVSGSAILTFYVQDAVYEYNTMYDVQAGIWNKSYTFGNLTMRYNFIQTVDYGSSTCGFTEGEGQTVPGFTTAIYNNIVLSRQFIEQVWTDSQPAFAGSLDVHNNTWYWPFNDGSVLIGAQFWGGQTTSGLSTFTPAVTGLFYNNLWNAQAGGSTINSQAYLAGNGAGTSSAPTSVNITLSDYNLYDVTSTTQAFNLAKGGLPQNFNSLGTYTLVQWQADAGLDAASQLGTPTYVSANLGYQYPTSNFQLATGSTGKGMGRVGGTSGGAAVDVGAWGGTDVNTGQPVAQIGSNF